MRLTNSDDQNVIKKLLPDSIGNFADLLPILDIGEAIAVGDASLLPSLLINLKSNPIVRQLSFGLNGLNLMFRIALITLLKQ